MTTRQSIKSRSVLALNRERQSNIIWPVTFEKKVENNTIIRSDRGRKWMKRLEIRKKMRTNASYVLNPTQHLPSIPSIPKRENHMITYDIKRITNKMLRENLCNQIVTPLTSTSSSSNASRRVPRRRQKKKKKKNVPSLTPLEEASKRLDEIFTIKNNVTGISRKSRIVPSKKQKPAAVTQYRVLASRMENVWSMNKSRQQNNTFLLK